MKDNKQTKKPHTGKISILAVNAKHKGGSGSMKERLEDDHQNGFPEAKQPGTTSKVRASRE